MVVVEGTQPLEGGAGRAQGDVTADDIDDVVGLFDLPNQGVVRQGPPVCRSAKRLRAPSRTVT